MSFQAITRRGLNREILRLAGPATLQALLQTVMFLVDTAMVSAYAVSLESEGGSGTAPLAAMGVTGPLVWSLTVIFSVTAVGTTALVGRRIGEGRPEEAGRITSTSLILAWISGAGVALCGVLLGPFLVSFVAGLVQGSGEELRGGANGYLFWFFLLFPFRSAALHLAAAYRGAGEIVLPVVGGVVANVVNAVGNAILIFGWWGAPRLGVEGAGLAVALASVVEMGLLYFVLRRGLSRRLRMPSLRRAGFSKAWARDILRISGPAGVDAVIFHAGFQAYQLAIFGLSEASVAAHRVAISLQSLAFLPGAGFEVSAASLSSRLLGARDRKLATTAAVRNLWLGVVCILPVALLFLLAAPFLARTLTEQATVVALGALCLRIGALETPFLLATGALKGTLQGAGETREPIIVSMVGTWLIRVPFSWILAYGAGWGLAGIWCSTVLDWIVRCGLLVYFFRRGRWRERVI